ncbi:CBS domain-containing protein [Rhizorhapis suberifaciens]|uniref:CBS domain-containing protein n=1 Tax=Rhizorhapis suberifaciens TaxID=13656 RepID=A0A840HX71_9SPHN|nr:CBS domain-containing protein [Rhizorhapis suberifaciens]MBB4642118.1 CBS domain-containing protein [Rhizorhapis suberifaciens]
MATINAGPRVAEAMSQGLWTAAPDMTIQQAVEFMAAEGLDMLTIEDSGGCVAGIISREIATDAAARNIGDLPVTAIMEPLREICHPGDRLERAKALMSALGTHDLPVCDKNGHPLGIISFGAKSNRSLYPTAMPTSFRPTGAGGSGRFPTLH